METKSKLSFPISQCNIQMTPNKLAFLLVCLIMLLEISALDELLLKPNLFQRNMFSVAPKRWAAYISKILFNQVNATIADVVIFDDYHASMNQHLRQLKYLAKVSLQMYADYFKPRMCTLLVLPRPLGMAKDSRVYGLNPINKGWIFKLHTLLRINITFVMIKFSDFGMNHCQLGNITLDSGTSPEMLDQSCFNVKHVLTSLCYCGQHSSLSSYLWDRYVRIIIFRNSAVLHNVRFHYGVMDSDAVITYEVIEPTIPNYGIFFTTTAVVLERYLIQTAKYRQLNISFSTKTTSYSIEVHDGPGLLSKCVTPRKETGMKSTYLTTTFQCIVLVGVQNAEKNVLSYDAVSNSDFKSLHIDQGVVQKYSHTSKMHISTIALFHITTVPSHQVCAKIISFSFTNRNNYPKCSFSGLAAYNFHRNTLSEIKAECLQYSGFYRYRNIYSITSSLILVIYSYVEYGQLNLSYELSSTHCKSVTISTCPFFKHCRKVNILNPVNFREVNLCTAPDQEDEMLYSEFKEGIIVGRKCTRIADVGREPNMIFTVSPGKCTIIQLTNLYSDLDLFLASSSNDQINICETILMRYKKREEKQRKITYSITGLIKGKTNFLAP